MTSILLIDLSSIAHPLWHTSASEPDPNATSTRTVERVRALASGQPHVAVCCDSGRSFRKDIDPSYKAQRPESDAALQHQITLSMETLRGDGFPVWAAKGYEADDLLASFVMWASIQFVIDDEAPKITIASSDKDLCALVNDRVHVKSLTNGNLYDTDGVLAKFGVSPSQMVDYLALVGDASDNIKGAKDIGPKKAAALLGKYGTLEDLYADLDAHGTNFTPGLATSLREFQSRMAVTRSLITLRTDAPIAFEEIFRERVPADTAVFGEEPMDVMDEYRNAMLSSSNAGSNPAPVAAAGDGQSVTGSRPDQPQAALSPTPVVAQTVPDAGASAAAAREDRRPSVPNGGASGSSPIGPLVSGPLQPAPQAQLMRQPVAMDFRIEDGPQTYDQAKLMAVDLFAAKLFNGYGSAPAVLSTIIIGRELGLNVGSSLRGFHIIEGKHAMHADLIRARVLSSPACEYFRITERTNERATFTTKRKGDPEAITLTYTIEDGRLAFGRDESTPAAKAQAEKAWKGSGWGKNPADMCVARASSKLARLVYPDVVHGFYAPEELD